jgi:hypothetical protein
LRGDRRRAILSDYDQGETAMVNIDRDERRTQRFQEVRINVNVDQMTEMLETAARRGDRDVRELAKDILKDGVSKVTGLHELGFGGDGRPPDPYEHASVRAGRNNYHVYLGKKGGRHFIVNITA